MGGRALAVSRISEEDMEPERPSLPVQPRAPPTSAPVSPPRIADTTDAPATAPEEPAAPAPTAAAPAVKAAAPVVPPVQDPPAAVATTKAAAPVVGPVQDPPAAGATTVAGPPKAPTHEAAPADPTKQPDPEAAKEQAHATGNGVSAAKDTAAPVVVTTRVLRLANMVRCTTALLIESAIDSFA